QISDSAVEVGSGAFPKHRLRLMKPLTFRAPLDEYRRQAQALVDGHRAGAPAAIKIIHQHHPRFLDETVKWRPKFLSNEDIQKAPFDLAVAELALGRGDTVG